MSAMEPVPEIPTIVGGDVRKTDERRISSNHSPRHSLLFDEQGRPIARPSGKSTPSGGESPMLPDTTTLKRKLHNLFLSGPSLRSRSSDGSLGSTASASPVSSGSPMEWPPQPTDTPTTGNFFLGDTCTRTMSRDITLEEELQTRLSQTAELARAWQAKWRQEREESCRLSDHLLRCESESKRIIDTVTTAYGKKNRMLEETLMKSMKNAEQLMIEKEMLEGRLKQSKEIIELQRTEIEKEFARARDDVRQLRSEVGNMQDRTHRLERDNDKLRQEKEVLTNDLKLFAGNAKNFNTTLKETDARCELYRILLDISMKKLKHLEKDIGVAVARKRPLQPTNNGNIRYVLRVDSNDPTSMHVEDIHETLKNKMAAEGSIAAIDSCKSLTDFSTDPASPLRVSQTVDTGSDGTETSSAAGVSHGQSSVSPLVMHGSLLTRVEKAEGTQTPVLPGKTKSGAQQRKAASHESPTLKTDGGSMLLTVEDKTKSGKKPRRFSFGKDSMKPKNIIKQLSGGGGVKTEKSTPPLGGSEPGSETVSFYVKTTQTKTLLDTPQNTPPLGDMLLHADDEFDDEDMDNEEEVFARSTNSPLLTECRVRSFSDSEDFGMVLDEAADFSESREASGTGRVRMEMGFSSTTVRSRSNTMDGLIEKPDGERVKMKSPPRHLGLSDSPTSSNEELRHSRSSGFEVLRTRRNGIAAGAGSAPESGTRSRSFITRKYKSKELNDLVKFFTSADKDTSTKDVVKANTKRRGLFGK